jgi:hypothetical protein
MAELLLPAVFRLGFVISVAPECSGFGVSVAPLLRLSFDAWEPMTG